FFGSQGGVVYSLDARSGCSYWAQPVSGGVRTAISIGRRPGSPGEYSAYFGDTNGSVYAVDASTGVLLWKRRVVDHPLARITGAPALFEDRLYAPVTSFEEGD